MGSLGIIQIEGFGQMIHISSRSAAYYHTNVIVFDISFYHQIYLRYAKACVSAKKEKTHPKTWISETHEVYRWQEGTQATKICSAEKINHMKIYHYTAVFQKEPEGGYTVIVPALKGCVTWGKTVEEAKKSAGEAIKSYLGSLAKDNESFPPDVSFVGTIDVQASPRRAYA